MKKEQKNPIKPNTASLRSCSWHTPGDCIPGGGGTFGDWLTHWREQIQQISTGSFTEMFEELGVALNGIITSMQFAELERLLKVMNMDKSQFSIESINVFYTNKGEIFITDTNEYKWDILANFLAPHFNNKLPDEERKLAACSLLISTAVLLVAAFLTNGTAATLLTNTAPGIGLAACTLIY